MTADHDHTALARLDRELLTTVGVAPDEAAPADLMLAISQAPRQQLAERWVETTLAQNRIGGCAIL